MTIGALSTRGGVPASALRFSVWQGLISSRRTVGNQRRRYHRSTLRRVAFIHAAQDVGIPLSVSGEVLGILPPVPILTQEVRQRASECWKREVSSPTSHEE